MEIKQAEKGALEFAKNDYGEALADAIYLGTYKGVSYFGPVFYEKEDTRDSFLITYCDERYGYLPSEKFSLDSDDDLKEFEHRQHIWWDLTGVIQCAFRRGKREAYSKLSKQK